MKLQRYDIFATNSIRGIRAFAEESDEGRYILASDAEAIVNKLKCCMNCKHGFADNEDNCAGCSGLRLEKWEIKE